MLSDIFVDLETGTAHAGTSALFLERGSTFRLNVRTLYANTELPRHPTPNSTMLLLLSLYFDEPARHLLRVFFYEQVVKSLLSLKYLVLQLDDGPKGLYCLNTNFNFL